MRGSITTVIFKISVGADGAGQSVAPSLEEPVK
jgi:hypothetical protein